MLKDDIMDLGPRQDPRLFIREDNFAGEVSGGFALVVNEIALCDWSRQKNFPPLLSSFDRSTRLQVFAVLFFLSQIYPFVKSLG